MAVLTLDYVVESFVWEVFGGREDEVVISGWLTADIPPRAMTLEVGRDAIRRFPIAAINLPSPHLADLMGERARNARFHAVIRVGDDRPAFTSARLLVDFDRRRVGIEVGSVFDNGAAATDNTVALLSRCESLGDSCEFGFVQRKLGIDQLGLFRFTGSGDPLRIADAIRDDFKGFAEADDLEAGELLGEWVVKSRLYEFVLHTGRFPYAISEADIRRKESIKLRYLARKFVEDLIDAEKLFVRRVEDGRERGMHELFAAMRERGPNRMIWVTLADDANPHGTIREVADGLYRGYIGYLAPLDRALENRPDQWVDLLPRMPGMDGAMDALPPDDQPIFVRIADIIRDSLDEPELALAPATTARDVEGWDSIAMINIILDVQKAFDVRFRSSEVDKLSCIADFVALTRRKMEGAVSAPSVDGVTTPSGDGV